MSAGDPVIRGAVAPAGSYTEMTRSGAVTGSFVPGTFGLNIEKNITRTLICLKKDVKTILQALAVTDVSLNAVKSGVDSTGASTTIDYGGGWTLKRYATPPLNSTTCEINLTYEKIVTAIFEFGLPSNLTLVETNGTSTFRYKTTNLEAWTSGKSTTTTGLTTELTQQHWPLWSNGWIQYYYATVNLYCDGVLKETFSVDTRDYPDFDKGVHRTTGTPIAFDPSWSDAQQVQHMNSGYIWPTPNINRTLRWDTSTANHIKLVFWDQVWKDWGITGL